MEIPGLIPNLCKILFRTIDKKSLAILRSYPEGIKCFHVNTLKFTKWG